MIQMDRAYRTYAGFPVEVQSTCARGERPVMGRYYRNGTWWYTNWRLNGMRSCTRTIFDLVDIGPKCAECYRVATHHEAGAKVCERHTKAGKARDREIELLGDPFNA